MVSGKCRMIGAWQIILVLSNKHKNMYLGHKPENKRREPSIEEDRGISKKSCDKETIEHGGFTTEKRDFSGK